MAETPSPARAGARFAALDSWRGICACSVVLFHLNAATHFHQWLNRGYVAVDFFFVLSGFVIASAYAGRIDTSADLARFSVRRVGRLYPLHLVVLLTYLALESLRVALGGKAPFTGERSWPAFFADLALVQGFGRYDLSWNAPAWSISIELWTNFVFALLAAGLRRRLTLGMSILTVAMTAALITSWPLNWRGPEAVILGGVLQCMAEFFAGATAFSAFVWARRRGWAPPGWLEWPALAGVILVFAFAPTFDFPSAAVVFLAAVVIFAFETGPVSRALKLRPALRLGEISFSIYLTHSLYTLATYILVGRVGRALGQTWVQFVDERDLLVLGGPWVMDLAALTCLAVVIASSIMTYRYIEDPARIAFNQLSNRLRTGQPREVMP